MSDVGAIPYPEIGTDSQPGDPALRQTEGNATTPDSKSSFLLQPPAINLPKGGGAIRSIDEKFSVNAVNGTATLNIPFPVSASRGLTPDLSLNYNSGAGNGIFGMGWSPSISSIRRKTDLGLPRYGDIVDTDTYILAGSEDLVPEYQQDAKGDFIPDGQGGYQLNEYAATLNALNYTVRRYRPRTEGIFARIERWTNLTTGLIHWRVISRENLTTIYGRTDKACVTDPLKPTRIFEWMVEFTYDDKQNCILYEYMPEKGEGMDPSQPYNFNRTNGSAPFTNTYLKRIWSGITTPYAGDGSVFPATNNFFCETVLDYGDHDPLNLPYPIIKPWDFRTDPFSSYRPGFEVRTCRLCKRVLLYYHFKQLPGGSALVRSLDLQYDTTTTPGFTFLQSTTISGYIKQDDGAYGPKNSYPPFSFTYQKYDWDMRVKTLPRESLENAPAGIDGGDYHFVDLYSEGLPGILTEQASAWWYKSNLGGGNFTASHCVRSKPAVEGYPGRWQLQDLDANGIKELVSWQPSLQGYFSLSESGQWDAFQPFEAVPNIDFANANTRLLDLDGDGRADVLITEQDVFTWYPSLGSYGFAPSLRTAKMADEEKGAAIVFSDAMHRIYLADMTGDGLTDIVRIRNGEVCYWPNLGFARFGAKVTMGQAPIFDADDHFSPAFLHLADIDGSGTTDIIYADGGSFHIWLNQQGNAFQPPPKDVDRTPATDNLTRVQVTDLLGTGLSCIVWNDPLPENGNRPVRYVDLMASKKPHILTRYTNNMGKEVDLSYTPSTQFYVSDKLAGTPWITKLHFVVQCVSTVTTRDFIRKTRFVSLYSYHHGYYDHVEREFRGFGRVDQQDTETVDNFILQDTGAAGAGAANAIIEQPLQQPPVLTKSWFHTGAYFEGSRILSQFQHEYFNNPVNPENQLPEAELDPGMTAVEYRQAIRSFKGMLLRKEVYALDNGPLAQQPYYTEQHNRLIRMLQPKGWNLYAVFLVHESESISYHYERNPADPRVSHSLVLNIDDVGNILSAASIAYGRDPLKAVGPEQTVTSILYTDNFVTNAVDGSLTHRTPLIWATVRYQLTGVNPDSTGYFSLATVQDQGAAAALIDYDTTANGTLQRRILDLTRANFWQDDTTAILPFGVVESKALPAQQYKAAFTDSILNGLLAARLSAAAIAQTKTQLLAVNAANSDVLKGGYTLDNINLVDAGNPVAKVFYWLTSGQATYDVAHFYLPQTFTDSFGHATTVAYDNDYHLFVQMVTDPVGNSSQVLGFNYRVIAAYLMADMNSNRTAVRLDELGNVVKTFVLGPAGIQEGDVFDTTKVEMAGAVDQPTTQLTYSLTAWFSQNIPQAALDSWGYKPNPNFVQTTAYETHYYPQQTVNRRSLVSYSYLDGSGGEVMKKVPAKPANANPRWIGTGRTILNNKGTPVKQYEPYFSTTSAFEDEKDLVETGVTPILYYDAIGRLIHTALPDGNFTSVEFDSWMQVTSDAVDNTLQSPWYAANGSPDPNGPEPANPQTRAAWMAALLAGTPSAAHYDPLGHSFRTVQQNRSFTTDSISQKAVVQPTIALTTTTDYDILGNILSRTDTLGNPVMQYGYDLSGSKVFQNSMDGGRRWLLGNVESKPLLSWDEKDQAFTFYYDALNRPVKTKVSQAGGAARLFNWTIYGETIPPAPAAAAGANCRGKIYQQWDTAGRTTFNGYDFKGNTLQTSTQLLQVYDDGLPPDWAGGATLDPAHVYTAATAYDALNRTTKLTTPDGSIQYHVYNAAGLLELVLLDYLGKLALTPAQETADTLTANMQVARFVLTIDYNEKGQRSRIVYGNNTITGYSYDPKTFRLLELKTTDKNATIIYQDLVYVYDPVGNISQATDNAQATLYFGQTVVNPTQKYTYDALYQLTQATGREQIGQNTLQESNGNANYRDFPFAPGNLAAPGDTVAMRNYTQTYAYDYTGNITSLNHSTGNNAGFTRTYLYNNNDADRATCGVSPAVLKNNRLLRTQIAGQAINYTYDVHGNLTSLPHLTRMDWNFRDEMMTTATTLMANNAAGTTWYTYDAGGIRRGKFTNAQGTGNKGQERIYFGGYEVYRQYAADGITVQLERQTLHIMDDQARIALIETKTADTGGNDRTTVNAPYIRYQYSNQLTSACLELNGTIDPAAAAAFQPAIISYEEYHPYGTSSFQAMNSLLNPIAKRYRYTGLERDEENGLGYHNARYYIPWLGRWAATDAASDRDVTNLYAYVKNNPIVSFDRTGLLDANSAENFVQLFYKNGVKAFSIGPKPVAPVVELAPEAAPAAAGVATVVAYASLAVIGVGLLGAIGFTGYKAYKANQQYTKAQADEHQYDLNRIASEKAKSLSIEERTREINTRIALSEYLAGNISDEDYENTKRTGLLNYLKQDPEETASADAQTSRSSAKAIAKREVELGIYSDVGGHHFHSRAALRNKIGYNPNTVLTISEKELKRLGIQHKYITYGQRVIYTDWFQSGLELSEESFRSTELQSLMEAGMTMQDAIDAEQKAWDSLQDSAKKGPFRIPYSPGKKK